MFRRGQTYLFTARIFEAFRRNSAKLFAVLSSLDSAPKASSEIFGALRMIAIPGCSSAREIVADGFLSPPQCGHGAGFFSLFIFLLFLEVVLLKLATQRLPAKPRQPIDEQWHGLGPVRLKAVASW
jgi:hypothetical protein